MTITEKERAKELYALGISQTEIGRQLGYSYGTIHRFLTQEKIDPMIGQKFGRLTVIKEVEQPKNKKTPGKYYYCSCDCGGSIIAVGIYLRNGNTKSCGCLVKENSQNAINKINKYSLDVTGQKFGKLTALYPTDKRSGTSIKWHCRCECGNECDVSLNNLKKGNVKSCGCLISTGEAIIYSILTKKNITFQTQYIYQDLLSQNGNPLRFDFAINLNNNFILLEYQGIQHFNKNNKWHTDELIYNDQLKKEYCKQHNIPLYYITYNDNIEEMLERILTQYEI